LAIEGSGYSWGNKKPPEGGYSPSFFMDGTMTYRFPFRMALAPLIKTKGCRAAKRANSLTATLDRNKTYYLFNVLNKYVNS
jgi:hypothetical protein